MRIVKVVFGDETVVYLDNGEKLEGVIAVEACNSVEAGRVPSVKVEILMVQTAAVDTRGSGVCDACNREEIGCICKV